MLNKVYVAKAHSSKPSELFFFDFRHQTCSTAFERNVVIDGIGLLSINYYRFNLAVLLLPIARLYSRHSVSKYLIPPTSLRLHADGCIFF